MLKVFISVSQDQNNKRKIQKSKYIHEPRCPHLLKVVTKRKENVKRLYITVRETTSLFDHQWRFNRFRSAVTLVAENTS